MKILIDTNFVLSCVKQGIHFDSLADEIFDSKLEWIVPQQVLNELGNLKERPGMKNKDRDAAALSFDVLNSLNPEIVELGRNPNVDIGIVNFIRGKEIILATLDRGLKNRVENRIFSRQNKKGRD